MGTDFHNFYYNLESFIHNPGARIQTATDSDAVDLWDSLFSDTTHGGARIVTTASSRNHPIQHPTTAEECSNADPNKPSQVTPVLDPQLPGGYDLFINPVLASLATWEIDILHKYSSHPCTKPVKARYAISKFDDDFQNSPALNVQRQRAEFNDAFSSAVPGFEWQPAELDDFILREGDPLHAFDSATGIKKHTDNSIESSRSYNYDGATKSSQSPGFMGRNHFSKRGRDENDPNEGRRRKKKDQSSQNPPRASLKAHETFSCPFKGRTPPGSCTIIKACSTDFPNLSKVKYVCLDF